MIETGSNQTIIEYHPLCGYIALGARRLYLSPFEERLTWVLYQNQDLLTTSQLQPKLSLPGEKPKSLGLMSRLISKFRHERLKPNNELSAFMINGVEKNDNQGWFYIPDPNQIRMHLDRGFRENEVEYVYRQPKPANSQEAVQITPVFNTVTLPDHQIIDLSHNEMEILLILSDQDSQPVKAGDIGEQIEFRFNHTVPRTQVFNTANRLTDKVPLVQKTTDGYRVTTDVAIGIPKQNK